MINAQANPKPKLIEETIIVAMLALAGIAVALFWAARYGGWSTEADTVILTQAAQATMQHGALITDKSYSNGFGYPALLTFISSVTGIQIIDIQGLGGVWLGVLLVAAYLAFRELLRNRWLAAIGVFLLLLQPDFLFYILRSSHERTTWTFGLLILWLWVKTLNASSRTLNAANVLAIYLLLWAMIANNAFLASTIITTYCISLALGFVIRKLRPQGANATAAVREQRLFYFSLVGFLIVYLFVSYLYQPAGIYYLTLASIADKIASLFAAAEPSAQPYATVQSAWLSPTIYLALTAFQWAIVLASGLAWLRDAWRMLRGGLGALSYGRLLLWLFYTGFAAQIVFGVVADYSGVLVSNLQVRLFTPFALLISPMAATWFGELKLPRRISRPALNFAAASLACLAILASLIKVTNDPLLGNQWLFYQMGEQNALDWVDQHLSGRTVWIDDTIQQAAVLQYRKGYEWSPANNYRIGLPDGNVTHVLLSNLTAFHAARTGLPIPAVGDDSVVFDNGEAKLYERRALTPFQK